MVFKVETKTKLVILNIKIELDECLGNWQSFFILPNKQSYSLQSTMSLDAISQNYRTQNNLKKIKLDLLKI